jgi:hypothetical protein
MDETDKPKYLTKQNNFTTFPKMDETGKPKYLTKQNNFTTFPKWMKRTNQNI